MSVAILQEPLLLKKGAAWRMRFQWLDSEQDPADDITEYGISTDLRLRTVNGTNVQTLTVDNGGFEIIDGPNAIFEMVIETPVSDLFTVDLNTSKPQWPFVDVYFDIELTPPGISPSERVPFLMGVIRSYEQVTRSNG